MLLGGYLPFDDDTEDGVFDRTRNAQYEFYPDYWKQVSASAKNLVVGLLTVNPTKRISANQALNHEWMRQQDGILARRSLSVATLQKSIMAKKHDRRQHDKKAAPIKGGDTSTDRLQDLHDAFNSYMTRHDDDTATVFTTTTFDTKPRAVDDSSKGLPFKHFYKLGETVRLIHFVSCVICPSQRVV